MRTSALVCFSASTRRLLHSVTSEREGVDIILTGFGVDLLDAEADFGLDADLGLAAAGFLAALAPTQRPVLGLRTDPDGQDFTQFPVLALRSLPSGQSFFTVIYNMLINFLYSRQRK